jgi:hypothetical protein
MFSTGKLNIDVCGTQATRVFTQVSETQNVSITMPPKALNHPPLEYMSFVEYYGTFNLLAALISITSLGSFT